MREYARLLCKRIIRRSSNIWLFFITLGILGCVFALNLTMQSELRNSFDSQIVTFENAVNQNEDMLSDVSNTSTQIAMYQSTIELNKSFKSKYEEMRDFYDHEDWASFYETYQRVLKEQSKIYSDSMGNNCDSLDTVVSSNTKQLAYIEYLDEHNLAYEEQRYPVYALSFVTAISQTILPILVLICCMYIIAQLFTIDYHGTIDIGDLLPIGKKKKVVTKLLLGMGISLLIFLLVLLVIFLVSFCITSNLGFDYPLMIQESGSSLWKAVSLISICKEWIIIGILFYISTSFATYLLSNYIKDEVPLFLSMLCMILVLAYLPKISSLLIPIAHYLPTTYLNFVNILNNHVAHQYSNAQISYPSGIIILSISILFQGILVYLKLRQRKQKIMY